MGFTVTVSYTLMLYCNIPTTLVPPHSPLLLLSIFFLLTCVCVPVLMSVGESLFMGTWTPSQWLHHCRKCLPSSIRLSLYKSLGRGRTQEPFPPPWQGADEPDLGWMLIPPLFEQIGPIKRLEWLLLPGTRLSERRRDSGSWEALLGWWVWFNR